MKFIAENFDGKDLANPDWSKIEQCLKQINRDKNCYFILTADSGNYIQCAGSYDEISIEYRELSKNGFKHYVLGMGHIESPLKTIWHTINCKIGPIRIHKNEVLTLEDALATFKFFRNKIVDLTWMESKRN
jgi:hypothetical protein